MKRSAIKRGSIEKAKAWKRRSKPLNKRSAKMARIYREHRAPFVAAFLAAHPQCEFPDCLSPSQDCHEVVRRSHGGALYPGQPSRRPTRYVALCRLHHDWTTTHPREAQAMGLDER